MWLFSPWLFSPWLFSPWLFSPWLFLPWLFSPATVVYSWGKFIFCKFLELIFIIIFVILFLWRYVCVQRWYSGYYSGRWIRRSLVQVPSGCQYSLRVDRLHTVHRTYPSLYLFGVVHVGPLMRSRPRLSVKTVNRTDGCNLNCVCRHSSVKLKIQRWTVHCYQIRCLAII